MAIDDAVVVMMGAACAESGNLGLGFKKIVLLVLLEEELGALNGVQRGTLLDLITADEEVQTIVTGLGDVLTDATDVDVIVVGGVERGGETVVRAVINDGDALRLG